MPIQHLQHFSSIIDFVTSLLLKMRPTLIFLGIAAAQELPVDLYGQSQDILLSESAPFGVDKARLAISEDSEPASCVDQVGNGPLVDPDTVTAFLANPTFSQAATSAAANAPDRYYVVPDWINMNGSNGDNTGYLGYVQSQLSSYDPDQCASLCNNWSNSTPCVSFLIYYERDIELVWSTTRAPSDEHCPPSANSSSITLIKCAFYSVPLYSGNATNVGQYQGDFHVVVAGSTAFNMEAPTIDGWNGPVDLHGAALNIPAPVDQHGYISVQVFPNDAYDPRTCATNCQTTTAYNPDQGSTVQCTSFNAYVVYIDGSDG